MKFDMLNASLKANVTYSHILICIHIQEVNITFIMIYSIEPIPFGLVFSSFSQNEVVFWLHSLSLRSSLPSYLYDDIVFWSERDKFWIHLDIQIIHINLFSHSEIFGLQHDLKLPRIHSDIHSGLIQLCWERMVGDTILIHIQIFIWYTLFIYSYIFGHSFAKYNS